MTFTIGLIIENLDAINNEYMTYGFSGSAGGGSSSFEVSFRSGTGGGANPSNSFKL